ncbi:MAG: trehalase-like protein [Chloroflexota bacterium]|nr:trehalase-like protein [Chloroflexota bacterium]
MTETEEEIRQAVRKMLLANTHEGWSDRFQTEYCYIQPSPGTYPYQYFWDTCLHVFILTALDEHGLAMKNMVSLFAMQEDDGFVGHMLFWSNPRPAKWSDIFQGKPSPDLLRPHMSALIQPPLVAQTVQRIHDGTGDRTFLQLIVPKLKRYFAWLERNRDFDGDGLLTIVSPFESGMDWKPTFDEVVGFRHGVANRRLFWRMVGVDARNFLHRYNLDALYRKNYFLVKEVAFNTIYAQNLTAMADLCDILGDADATRYRDRARRVMDAMIEQMYDAESAAFYDIYTRSRQKIRVVTPTILFPLVIRDMPRDISDALVDRHIFTDGEFAAPYPIPSVATNDSSFDPGPSEYLWRGPTWVFSNWFVYQCLYYRDYKEQAELLRQTILKLIRQSGFREYYDPFTGEGYGAQDFTWSGLVVDMLNIDGGAGQPPS